MIDTDVAAEDRRTWGSGVLASLALHGVLSVALLLTVTGSPPPVLPSQAIEVELLAAPPASPNAVPRPHPTPPPRSAAADEARPGKLAALPDASREPQRSPAAPAMITASRMLSEAVLADPRSRQGKALLAQLATDDRSEQLCGIEAMAQVAAWNRTFRPDQVVAYAMGEPTIAGRVLLAEGAALHSGDAWYRLAFQCELAPDLKTVTSFAFLVGAAIPRRDWDSHNLPAGDGPVE